MGYGADPPPFLSPPEVVIGHVHLRVSDLRGSLGFYRDLLGLRAVGNPRGKTVHLSPAGEDPYLLALTEASSGGGDHPVIPQGRRAGLYHFALLLPDRRDLASVVQHLLAHKDDARIEGAADHGVSESFYIRDPDFHGIEITWDKPRASWKRTDHRVEMRTAALDLARLMEETDPRGWRGPRAGTTIGHVHLHVPNLPRALEFYTRGLGLHLTSTLPRACFFAADEYHHHVATNVWLGEGIPPAPSEGPGLDHFALRFATEGKLRRTVNHLRDMGIAARAAPEQGAVHSAFLWDPAQIKIQLYEG